MIKKILLGIGVLSTVAAAATGGSESTVNITARLFKPVTITAGAADTTLNMMKNAKGAFALPTVDLNVTGAPGKAIILETKQTLVVALSSDATKTIPLDVSFGDGTSTNGTNATLTKVLEPSGEYTGLLKITGNRLTGSPELNTGIYSGTVAITAKYN